MKLGFLPLFKPESFQENSFHASGLDYFSAHLIGELIAWVHEQVPEIQCFVQLSLGTMLKRSPDIVVIWSTSPCFGQVASLAENLKTYLDIPIWLGGPHISYLPNSLPDSVDVGILGEAEMPLLALLKAYLSQGDKLGPVHYRKIAGLIYQSRGRMYSGSPAQEVPNINRLPTPEFQHLQSIQGFSAPIVRTSRINDTLITALAYPPTRKPRLLHPEQICNQIEQVIANYKKLLVAYQVPANQARYLRPIFIPDFQFVLQKKRLEALRNEILKRRLHVDCFFIVHLPPDAITDELLKTLKGISVSKIALSLGPLGHQSPLLPPCSASTIKRAIALCQHYHIGLMGQLFLNPEVNTRRRQLAQTYRFFAEEIHGFERLHVSVLGPFPGTALWEHYQAQSRLKQTDLAHVPWDSFDWEHLSTSLPLAHTELDRPYLTEAYHRFKKLFDTNKSFKSPIKEDLDLFAKAITAQQFSEVYLNKTDRVLEVVASHELVMQPFLFQSVEQIFVKAGKLSGSAPQQPVNLIFLLGVLNCLRDPDTALAKLSSYLAPEGRLYISIANPLFLGNISQILKWKGVQSSVHNKILKFIKPEQVIQMLEKHGFVLINQDYTIMEEVEAVRPTVETLANAMDKYGSLRIPQDALYVNEIKMLAAKRT